MLTIYSIENVGTPVPSAPGGPKAKWTLEQVTRVGELLEKGLSYDQIANKIYDEFGVRYTRNAVISRARRSGVDAKGGGRPTKKKAVARREPPRGKVIRFPFPKAPPVTRSRVRKPPQLTHVALSENERVYAAPLLSLKALDCRWPVSREDERVTLFCCRPKMTESSPYCPHHMARAARRLEGEK